MKKITKIIRKWWIVPLVLITLFFFMRGKLTHTQGTKNTHIIQKQTLQQVFTLSGSVKASETATLRFQLGGKLVWLGIKEGDTVRSYQILAQLDTREVQKKLEKQQICRLLMLSVTNSIFLA